MIYEFLTSCLGGVTYCSQVSPKATGLARQAP